MLIFVKFRSSQATISKQLMTSKLSNTNSLNQFCQQIKRTIQFLPYAHPTRHISLFWLQCKIQSRGNFRFFILVCLMHESQTQKLKRKSKRTISIVFLEKDCSNSWAWSYIVISRQWSIKGSFLIKRSISWKKKCDFRHLLQNFLATQSRISIRVHHIRIRHWKLILKIYFLIGFVR